MVIGPLFQHTLTPVKHFPEQQLWLSTQSAKALRQTHSPVPHISVQHSAPYWQDSPSCVHRYGDRKNLNLKEVKFNGNNIITVLSSTLMTNWE